MIKSKKILKIYLKNPKNLPLDSGDFSDFSMTEGF